MEQQQPEKKHKRRVRYKGTHPRRFEEKYINVMSNGEELEITFEVYSGFPLYLSVSGVGPRNSNVRASIKAVSADGLIELPELRTEQYQNEEGPNMLKHPYCEYFILP